MDLPRYDTIFSQISQALCGQKGKKKSPLFFKEKNRGLFYWNDQANKPGSVVMTIYLDRRLLDGSSHIDRWQNCRKRGRRATVQPFAVTVLLRIGFTWQCSLLHPGELLPRLSTLTVTSHGGISLLHCPYGRPRLPLAAILPCEARTFLTHSLSALCPLLSRLLAFPIIVYFCGKVKSVFFRLDLHGLP